MLPTHGAEDVCPGVGHGHYRPCNLPPDPAAAGASGPGQKVPDQVPDQRCGATTSTAWAASRRAAQASIRGPPPDPPPTRQDWTSSGNTSTGPSCGLTTRRSRRRPSGSSTWSTPHTLNGQSPGVVVEDRDAVAVGGSRGDGEPGPPTTTTTTPSAAADNDRPLYGDQCVCGHAQSRAFERTDESRRHASCRPEGRSPGPVVVVASARRGSSKILAGGGGIAPSALPMPDDAGRRDRRGRAPAEERREHGRGGSRAPVPQERATASCTHRGSDAEPRHQRPDRGR